MSSLREENERLSEVIEDLNIQLLNQHVSRLDNHDQPLALRIIFQSTCLVRAT